MACLSSCFYTTRRNIAVDCLSDNTNDSPRPVHTHTLKPPLSVSKPPPTTTTLPRKTKKQQKPRQPSVIEIERAIGAGRFRDTDLRELEEQKNVNFDMSMMNFPGKFEGPLEKKLRATGEWVTNQSERGFSLSSKKVVIFVFQWMLPLWTLSLLIASGVIKLPFSSPFLDQLIM